jgi:hypothetical protein
MTTKADFSPTEWETVLEGSPTVGLMVITASRGEMLRETMAMSKAYAQARAQHGESGLLDEIVARDSRFLTRKRELSRAGGSSRRGLCVGFEGGRAGWLVSPAGVILPVLAGLAGQPAAAGS